MLTIFKKLFPKPKPAPRGLHIGATKDAVFIYNDGAKIMVTPDLADQLAQTLPRFAAASRALVEPDERP